MANVLPVALRAPEWTAPTSDAGEDLDEPPEKLPKSAFQRSTVRQPAEQPSLLTKAILAQSDEETPIHTSSNTHHRRRSITSNASSADLTSDTGYTSPSRVSTPSPPTTSISFLRLHSAISDNKPGFPGTRGLAWDAPEPAPRKRSIQFACGARPNPQPQAVPTAPSLVQTVSAAQDAPRRTCIKFACQARPAATENALPKVNTQPSAERLTPRRESALATTPTSARPSPTRRPSQRAAATRPRFLRATSGDLVRDGSQFHEFASDVTREDDWIRNDSTAIQTKLTINDTLRKENSIRRLATEVEEEEAQLEEEAKDAGNSDEDDDDNEDEGNQDDQDDDNNEDDDDNDDDGVDLDDYDAELEDDEDLDGYHTDEETGFADSDEEDDGDENMILWTPGHVTTFSHLGAGSARRFSMNEVHSDSSANSGRRARRVKSRPIGPTAEATDLPDSTDFVCGTLDEDRPLEDVFLSCLAARRTENLRLIPQDIDPSFPASDLDEEDEEDAYNSAQQESDSNVWVMDDLHHDQDRSRRTKGEQTPPRRLRSPPPIKRHQSPPYKGRGRSPKALFDGHSPRRMRSPAPKAMITPTQTPRQGAHIQFNLAGRPGLTHTKSLPRSAALFRHPKQPKCSKNLGSDNDTHVRGAIDIVKGLEKKRQRRKEKFMQKYCNRARRGQIPERKPLPGLGAERMKEVGLIMAGKKDQGNYVLSF